METQGFLRQFWLSWHNRKAGEVPGTTTLLQFNPLRKDLKMNEALYHTERMRFGNDLKPMDRDKHKRWRRSSYSQTSR
jgi:hypothetical protein